MMLLLTWRRCWPCYGRPLSHRRPFLPWQSLAISDQRLRGRPPIGLGFVERLAAIAGCGMNNQAARRPPPVPHAHIDIAAKPAAASSSKDVEAVPSRTASGVAPPPGLAPRQRTLLWVAIAVLVAACATAAIVLGVGASQSKGSSTNGSAAPPAQPQPPPAVSTPAAGANPGSVPAGAGSAAPTTAAAVPPASVPAGYVMSGTPPFTVPSGFTALWWDEFDSLDTSKWTLVTGPLPNPDGGVQTFTASPANVATSNGNLSITAVKEAAGYTSARLNSTGSWYPRMQLPDGRKVKSVHVAARIKLPPAGTGLQAGFSMLPVQIKDGAWSAAAEIGIMGSVDMKEVMQGVYYGDSWPADASDVKTKLSTDEEYHIFAVDWDRDTITTRIDGQETNSFEVGWTAKPSAGGPQPAPFDQPFSLILDVAVGSSWAGPPDASTPAAASMVVDYVRVFAKMAS
ncbi:hypothetical protein ABPG75_009916 [Micractinium tetrahymenae]